MGAIEGSDTLLALSAFFLIVFIPLTSQVFVFLPWLRPVTVNSGLVLFVFNGCVGMLILNYYLCVTTDPGRVAPGWEPEGLGQFGELEATSLTNGGETITGLPRYCRICNGFKPPRTHHCKRCGRCILRMDHHCQWLNNCIGHHNHGHFIRFLIFTVLSCGMCMVMIFARLLDLVREAFKEGTKPEPLGLVPVLFIAVNMCLLVPLTSILAMLLSQQLRNMYRNLTTIEYLEKIDASFAYDESFAADPYDLGCLENTAVILGDSPMLWLIPQRMKGDGHVFICKGDIEGFASDHKRPWE
ncbi:uncharacterized protein SPPG_09345 [Spizellomyces punctatus DAOM BR117]|uniref:Palmitoyltransferase n=1 Tax=Spizellomyces punctatus (strain DAOM BR117) TaxID=645134 RepID=A0A0L0HBX9_SPIPD|nr:uncharacterized protein SPPG_09345 [Spizellomyces punctatus DAOM BR117]KNC98384.1 hypothetical protein SPPG_09345 [Spizellomyces punctatus DAOM BR117]|eukprot:XP_016606424.1 hypothetical protein SPPG_09345 [Spizellomyces punctatus DAOM BR117]